MYNLLNSKHVQVSIDKWHIRIIKNKRKESPFLALILLNKRKRNKSGFNKFLCYLYLRILNAFNFYFFLSLSKSDYSGKNNK